MQVSIWVLGISAFLGNLFVIVWRIRTDASKASSFFVINLGCSDFLMGLYLLIIGSVDAHYRGVYIVHADAWRSSNLCQAAGFLAMLSRFVCRKGYAKDDTISAVFSYNQIQLSLESIHVSDYKTNSEIGGFS